MTIILFHMFIKLEDWTRYKLVKRKRKKKIYYVNTHQKKVKECTLVSDKICFKANKLYQEKRASFRNDKRVNSLRGHNNPKHSCTE